MKVGDRVVWKPAGEGQSDYEGVVIAGPGETVEASGAFVTIGPEAAAVRFDSPIDGTSEYIISTINVKVVS